MNQILVLGPPDVGKRFIISNLTGGSTTEWNIITKYYTAQVQFVLATTIQEAEACEGCQALALVVDSTKTSDLSQHANLLRAKSPELECTLVISNQRSEDAVIFDVQAEDAYDLGVEIVHVKYNPSVQKSANLLESSDGIDRIIKALQCVMWPEMQRQKPPMKKPQASPIVTSEHNEEEVSSSVQIQDINPPNIGDVGRYEPPDPQKMLDAMLGPDDVENNMQEFESLMHVMADTKENASNLSDEERRKRAEEVAMRLLKFMNLDDDLGEEDMKILNDIEAEVKSQEE